MRFHKVLALALLMAASLPAYGGPNEDAARAEYEKANAAYYQGRFDEAAARYQAVYGLVRDPNMLFNIGQSYSLGGRDEQALSYYRGFLHQAPADSPNRPQAERFIEELNRKLEAKRATPGVGPVPAPVPASAPAPAYAPTPTPSPAVPGGSPGYLPAATAQPIFTPGPQPWAAPEAAGSTSQADLLTQAHPPAPGGAADDRPFYKTWWFWTAAGAAVVAGTVTAFLLARKSPDACDGLGMDCMRVK